MTPVATAPCNCAQSHCFDSHICGSWVPLRVLPRIASVCFVLRNATHFTARLIPDYDLSAAPKLIALTSRTSLPAKLLASYSEDRRVSTGRCIPQAAHC